MKGRVATPDLTAAVLDPAAGLRGGRTVCQVVLTDIVPVVKAVRYTAGCRFGGIPCGTSHPVAFMSRADGTPTRLNPLACVLTWLRSRGPETGRGGGDAAPWRAGALVARMPFLKLFRTPSACG
jgi:hypothetical protein